MSIGPGDTSAGSDSSDVSLNPSTIVRSLGAIAAFLIVVGFGFQLAATLYPQARGVHFLSLDSEQSLPAFFSTLLLFTSALLLILIARLDRDAPERASKWRVLAGGFLLMSLDEACSIHERLILPVRHLLGDGELGLFYFAWVIPGSLVVVAVALYFRRFLRTLPARVRRRFLAAGALYVGGAIGIELFGGRHAEMYGMSNSGYVLLVALEEGLEIVGVLVFIRALLMYIADNFECVRLRVGTTHLDGQ